MALFGKKNSQDDDLIFDSTSEQHVEVVGKRSKGKTDPEDFTWASPFRPSAFLLPNYLTQRRALVKAKKSVSYLVVSGFITLAVISLITFGLRYVASTAQDTAEQARNDQQTELKSLAGVSGFFTGLRLRESTVEKTLNADIDYSKVVGAINDALPSGGLITVLTTEYGGNCPGPDPFVTVLSIGCINFTINVPNDAALEAFLSSANAKNAKNVVSFLILSTSNTGKDGVVAVGTANFTENTFTYRFAKNRNTDSAAAQTETPSAPVETTPTQIPTQTPTQGASQ